MKLYKNKKYKHKNYANYENKKNLKGKLMVNFNSTVQTSEEFILISNFKQKRYYLNSALLGVDALKSLL